MDSWDSFTPYTVNRSNMSIIKKEQCFITRLLVLLCRLTLATCAATPPACTDMREAVTSVATLLLDLRYILGVVWHNMGEYNMEICQNGNNIFSLAK